MKVEIVLNKDGKESFFCLKRKRYIKATPEERIRQETIKFLVEQKDVPLNMICVEMRLDKYDICDSKCRADIIIESGNEDDDGIYFIPMVVIECKNEGVPLSYKVIEQVENYAFGIQTFIYGVTNGLVQDWYVRKDGEAEYLMIEDLPNYNDLLQSKGYSFVKETPYFSEPQRDYHQDFPKRLIPLVDNLLNLFENTTDLLEPSFFGDFYLIEDSGLRVENNTNPSGYNWVGNYRYFQIKTNDEIISTVGFCIHILEIGAYLTVSMDGHHSLQYYLNNWVRLKGNIIEFWHDGTMTTGKGSAKRQDVISSTYKLYPELIINNKIFLGSIDNSKKLVITDTDVLNLIENIIKYVVARETFREQIPR